MTKFNPDDFVAPIQYPTTEKQKMNTVFENVVD